MKNNGDCCRGDCGGANAAKNEGRGAGADILRIAAAALLFGLSFFPGLSAAVSETMLICAAFLTVFDSAYKALSSLFLKSVNEDTLLVIAVIAAFAIGEYREAAAVAILYKTGELLEDYAADRSRRSITALSEIRPDKANIRDGEAFRAVRAETVKIGDEIVVLPHERVALDGVVMSGSSYLDASALTGESLPLEAAAGTDVLSGMINGEGTLFVRTTRLMKDSASSRIISMVEDASERKGNAHRIITRIAKYYTPAVVFLAVALAVVPPLIIGGWREWIYKGLVLLVASCPCALVLSVPMSFFAGMGAAAKCGILVKGGLFVEKAAEATAVIFDKTGTLTTEKLKVSAVRSYNGFSEAEVIKFAASAEQNSKHPAAAAITEMAKLFEIEPYFGENFHEYAGKGTRVLVRGKEVLCGSRRFMTESGINVPDDGASVFISVDGVPAGSVEIDSETKQGAAQLVERLRLMGIKRIAMLTGDGEKHAARTAAECGISEYYSELLPEGKLEVMKRIKEEEKAVIYVGDGINDAPVLAFADVGAAVGLGSQAARETADIVLTGGISRLADALSMFRRVMKTVRFNIFFILAVKLAIMALGAAGKAPIWAAVFADVGVLLITMILSVGILFRTRGSKSR